ncbi:Arginase/deacetylase [Heliocybe sulcata]|uniref:Arginase/deacetylase n=1 Tax=Heliocybe sulcata TaxID=5364 RepID=A0A5C3MXF2_9AGAM|nr:Arginase/deacetylase [Heliocybe sulcata]
MSALTCIRVNICVYNHFSGPAQCYVPGYVRCLFHIVPQRLRANKQLFPLSVGLIICYPRNYEKTAHLMVLAFRQWGPMINIGRPVDSQISSEVSLSMSQKWILLPFSICTNLLRVVGHNIQIIVAPPFKTWFPATRPAPNQHTAPIARQSRQCCSSPRLRLSLQLTEGLWFGAWPTLLSRLAANIADTNRKFQGLLVLAAVAVRASQAPYRVSGEESADFERLFSSELLFADTWSRESWNGLVSFARAPPLRCFGADSDEKYDVAVLGAPFDTATSFRPGARFGPNGIRQGARRLGVDRINVPHKIRISDYLSVADCGDVPMTFVDNRVALRQLEYANKELLSHTAARSYNGTSLAKDGKYHPRVLTLGGDHTITLPLLRGVSDIYGPVSVIHFDSHLDTWKPRSIGLTQAQSGPKLPDEEIPGAINHGSYFYWAYKEGLLAPNNSNIHVGIRGALGSWDDYKNDWEVGFHISHAEDIEEVGYQGIVDKIKEVVGDNPVYITLDIDVVDPGMAPATGTPEIGGFTTREIKKILKGLVGLKIVGADIVEVAPAYDTQDEITQIAAANIGWDMLALMAKTPAVV